VDSLPAVFQRNDVSGFSGRKGQHRFRLTRRCKPRSNHALISSSAPKGCRLTDRPQSRAGAARFHLPRANNIRQCRDISNKGDDRMFFPSAKRGIRAPIRRLDRAATGCWSQATARRAYHGLNALSIAWDDAAVVRHRRVRPHHTRHAPKPSGGMSKEGLFLLPSCRVHPAQTRGHARLLLIANRSEIKPIRQHGRKLQWQNSWSQRQLRSKNAQRSRDQIDHGFEMRDYLPPAAAWRSNRMTPQGNKASRSATGTS